MGKGCVVGNLYRVPKPEPGAANARLVQSCRDALEAMRRYDFAAADYLLRVAIERAEKGK